MKVEIIQRDFVGYLRYPVIDYIITGIDLDEDEDGIFDEDWVNEYLHYNLVTNDHEVEDCVADNYATRGLLLELVELTNTGICSDLAYRAKLITVLTALWD